MSQPLGAVYRFGPFRYDAAQRLLFRNDELIPLVPKAIDTLHALLERRGEVVGKAELMKAVWPDAVVEEVGLARNISLLRKALGDDGEAYIETIPKRGYRFTAQVDQPASLPVETAQPVPPGVHRRAGQPRRAWFAFLAILLGLCALVYWQFYRPSRYLPQVGGAASLAVIPFECLSPDLERAKFSEGLNQALVAEIAKLKSAQIVSPSTIQRYLRLRIPTAIMTRLLGLDVILEGTAQTFGPQIRVSARLTDVHSGKLIWADGYDVAAADINQAEAAVARALAAQIGRRLSPP
ncbi:MAG: winged helix-turn-helix domain-containing protein [Bryobacteraceae bacterium]|nr:winged helix-turn-helix domain-containing protein [Bryobacteraceae bacterium]